MRSENLTKLYASAQLIIFVIRDPWKIYFPICKTVFAQMGGIYARAGNFGRVYQGRMSNISIKKDYETLGSRVREIQ